MSSSTAQMRGYTAKRRLRNGCNIGIIRPEASGICVIPGTSEAGHELAENPTDWLLRLVILHPHPRLAVDVVSILDDRNEHAVDDRADDRAVGASRTLSGVPVGSVTLQRSPPAADARVALSRNASAAIETLVNPSSLKSTAPQHGKLKIRRGLSSPSLTSPTATSVPRDVA